MFSDCTSYSSSLGYPAIPAIVSMSCLIPLPHTSSPALLSSFLLLLHNSAKNKCFFLLNTPHHFLAAPFSKFFTSWLCSISPTVTNRIICALHSFLSTGGRAQKRQIDTTKHQSLECPGPILHSGYFKTLLLFSIHLAYGSFLTRSRWSHFLCLRENKSLFYDNSLTSQHENLRSPCIFIKPLSLASGDHLLSFSESKIYHFLLLLNLLILQFFSIRIEKLPIK